MFPRVAIGSCMDGIVSSLSKRQSCFNTLILCAGQKEEHSVLGFSSIGLTELYLDAFFAVLL